jgi:hypothetical protein
MRGIRARRRVIGFDPRMSLPDRRRAAMATQQQARPVIDQSRVEEFVGRVIGDLAGTMTTVFCALGDQLGLFAALAEQAASSEDLAAKTGLQERYVREWANGLVTAGYLTRDPASGTYALPPEHLPVLADEGGLASLGGAYQTTSSSGRSVKAAV